jgi:anhydro-N-acetylmuramic acid kinase
VPIGEKYLFQDYNMFLNIGGIANISFRSDNNYIAFDICPANRVLNSLAAKVGKDYDANGEMASMGNVHEDLLNKLNGLEYYQKAPPKSLDNGFGAHNDSLRTYVEHIVIQIKNAITNQKLPAGNSRLLITGGGAFNNFLFNRLNQELAAFNIEAVVPAEEIVQYKEALIMAYIGVLRWRQEYTVIASVTGASRESIGGALWIGQEA